MRLSSAVVTRSYPADLGNPLRLLTSKDDKVEGLTLFNHLTDTVERYSRPIFLREQVVETGFFGVEIKNAEVVENLIRMLLNPRDEVVFLIFRQNVEGHFFHACPCKGMAGDLSGNDRGVHWRASPSSVVPRLCCQICLYSSRSHRKLRTGFVTWK